MLNLTWLCITVYIYMHAWILIYFDYIYVSISVCVHVDALHFPIQPATLHCIALHWIALHFHYIHARICAQLFCASLLVGSQVFDSTPNAWTHVHVICSVFWRVRFAVINCCRHGLIVCLFLTIDDWCGSLDLKNPEDLLWMNMKEVVVAQWIL